MVRIEKRAPLESLDEIFTLLEEHQAQALSEYSAIDYVYADKKQPINLDDSYLRVRSYAQSGWSNHLPVVVTFKEQRNAVWSFQAHTLIQAELLVKETYPTYEQLFSFHRKGQQFLLSHTNLYVEEIEGLGLSVELISPTVEDFEYVAGLLQLQEFWGHSLMQMIWKKQRYMQ